MACASLFNNDEPKIEMDLPLFMKNIDALSMRNLRSFEAIKVISDMHYSRLFVLELDPLVVKTKWLKIGGNTLPWGSIEEKLKDCSSW